MRPTEHYHNTPDLYQALSAKKHIASGYISCLHLRACRIGVPGVSYSQSLLGTTSITYKSR